MAKKKHLKPTNHTHKFHAAKMLVAFQKRPGIGGGKIILDAGAGFFCRVGEKPISISPVNGVYAIPLQEGELGTFELFDTVFTVASLSSGNDCGILKPSIINWPLPLLAANTLEGAQQRLQLLGFYTGKVDGNMGALMERAVLEFQAEEGSLLIDGDPGPKTKTALDTYFSKNGMDTSGLPIIRKYLISFKRFASGFAHWNSPHPDARGDDAPVVSYFYSKGIISWMLNYLGIKDSEQSFKVKMVRENFVPRKMNTYISVEPAAASKLAIDKISELSTPTTINPINCTAKDVVDGKIQVYFGAWNGPIIGEIKVKILPLLQVCIFIHIIDIKNAAGSTVVNKWTVKSAEKLIGDINANWASAGIEFAVSGSKTYSVIGKYPGKITNEFDDATKTYKKTEFYPLWKNHNIKKRINIYFANELLDEYIDASGNIVRTDTNTAGYALSRSLAGPTGYVGVCIRFDNDMPTLARTVAHELGHILKLTVHPHAHSDDNGTPTPFRHDIWSRSRLMAKYIHYYDNPPNRVWQDTDYGKKGNLLNSGSLITIKKLKMDGTDDELSIARTAQQNPF
jgi:hypothetical protein